ncbi:MAG TPA: response regulator [Pirellulales bacterium]|nr:response regulator [Pirellulales bacterium]
MDGLGIRVLVVDDQPDGAWPLGMLLKLHGYLVEVETDSERCLGRLESFKPDVVLLDIAMPKVSGYDLARQIRTDSRFETTVVIAISGYADQKHVEQSIEAGCNQHLVKPTTFQALNQAISHEVGKRKQSGGCYESHSPGIERSHGDL